MHHLLCSAQNSIGLRAKERLIQKMGKSNNVGIIKAMDPLFKRQEFSVFLFILSIYFLFTISQRKASVPEQSYNLNMYLESALFLFLTTLMPCISAVGNPDGITLFQRQASPTAAASTTLTSTTSTGDEISEAFYFNIDGKIFPPDVDVDDVTL